MRPLVRRTAAAVLVLLAACGPGRGTAGFPGGDSRVITSAEIEASREANLLDFIQRARPNWLNARYLGGSSGYPAVYLDRQLYGEIGLLRTFNLANVREVRFHDPVTATSVFGRGVPFGVIQIIPEVGN